MQCPSCQFENMPGSSHCARCAAALNLQIADIDVHPPRASRLQRHLPARQFASVRRGSQSFLSAAQTLVGINRPSSRFHGSLSEYLALVIPGWHQIRHGEVRRGQILLGSYFGFVALALLFAGTGTGSLLLGLTFGWHVLATVDAICRDFATSADRFRFTGLVMLALLLLLYGPALWLVGRVARPMRITMPTRHFLTGDVVWYRPDSTPKAGDLVLYDIPAGNATARLRRQPNTVYMVAGLRINRIVAVSGQTVREENGQLLVDGQVSPWQPTHQLGLPKEKGIVVRPDCVFILPEDLLPGNSLALNPTTTLRLAMVPNGQVRGAMLARTYPLTRFRFY